MESLKKKHGPLRYFPPKTTFNTELHFKPAYIFENFSEDGSLKVEVPKIPPLRKEPQGNRHNAKEALNKLHRNFGLSIDLNPAKDTSDDDDDGRDDDDGELFIFLLKIRNFGEDLKF